ncbi:MAG: ABC transporter permease [Actinobacteria bacterium]|nr:ABC transporter permease [Actinomycetota bacterium]
MLNKKQIIMQNKKENNNMLNVLLLKEKKKFKFPYLGIYSMLIYLFLYIPLIVVVLFSFSGTKSTVSFSSVTIKWYQELLKNSSLLSSLLHSLQVSLTAVFIAVIIGTSGAFFIVRANFPGKRLFITLAQLPIILPGIIIGIAMLIFFINLNIPLSMFTITMGHVSFTTPVIMFQVTSRLLRLGRTYEDAAKDLGANPIKTLFLVTIPMIKTAIIGGALLAFAMSFDEIIITYFLTGSWTTLPVFIYGMMRFGLSPQVYAISTVILFFSLIIIFFMARFTGTRAEELEVKK